MSLGPKLTVMLTHYDCTVQNAAEIFEKCKTSRAELWGFKDKPLPSEEMKALFSSIKSCGKTAVLEVVEYTEDECIKSALTAVECKCDILMGTTYFDSVNEICKKHNIKYMPFVGCVSERPSVLNGDIDAIINEAKEYLKKGVWGIDLLGYRYTGDCEELISRFVSEVDAPVCVAGSVNSYERLDLIKKVSPWSFTVGGAFFENRFGGDFEEQINSVCEYVSGGKNA